MRRRSSVPERLVAPAGFACVLRRSVCALLAVFAVVAAGGGAVRAESPKPLEFSLSVAGEERTYLVSRPGDAPPGPLPTVIALHGAMQSASGFRDYFGLDVSAARYGLVTVYPQGHGRVWNDGRPAAMRLKAMLRPGKDVEFLLALTDRLVAEGVADPRRVYLAGISNGGFMVQRMACEHADRFAAFSVIMASAPATYRESCQPSRPLPIMFIHGTADTVITYDGFWTPLGATLSLPDTAALYAQIDKCGESGPAVRLPDKDVFDGTTVLMKRWDGCADGVEVALFTVERGGHQSPARVNTLPDMATAFLGLRNHDIDAGEESLRFFLHYSLPPPAGPEGAAPLPAPAPRKPVRNAGQAAGAPAAKPAQRGTSTQ